MRPWHRGLMLPVVPIWGTIVLAMGTSLGNSIGSVLFGTTRKAVLALLFCHSDRSFYVREILQSVKTGSGAVQRELAKLTSCGLVTRQQVGNQVHYRANTRSPVFPELKSLVVKTFGVAERLRNALHILEERVAVAFIYGSFAKGAESADSDLDVIVIGDVSFSEVVDALGPAQEQLFREVNPTVYPVQEFLAKLTARHHFVTSLVGQPKIFLIGDEDEFERMVGTRVATEHNPSSQEIADLLAVVDRDLRDAATEGLSPDWRLNIAYNAALQAATAALAASGYRAARQAHHYRVIESLRLTVQADNSLVRRFDAFRKKRNIGGYERAGTVSAHEADEMMDLARGLRERVIEWIRSHHPNLAPE